jgi:ABC-type nitrate/sulfonate/bicarbonate transport system ATPase subunit
MIEITGLTFGYGGGNPPVFDGFDWKVEGGQAWAVIGPSGCGKTTLLYLLAGLRVAEQGEVRIAGQVVRRPRPETGLILQDYGLLPWATVWDNARLGLTVREFYGPDGRHAPRNGALGRAAAEERVTSWLKRLGIYEQRDKFPAQLSGGQRQRTAIARTLALDPDLLLMDEPFSSLDALTREDMQDLTVELRRETQLTSVLVTHSIEEAVFLGERILALGMPPNRTARVIENPGAGRPGYRGDPTFQARAEQLRALLGVRA